MASKLRVLDPATAHALVTTQSIKMVAAAEFPNVFTQKECAEIIALRDSLGWDEARIETRKNPGESETNTQIRNTQRSHIIGNSTTAWIYDRMAAVIEQINAETWQLRLGHMEPIQLLHYATNGHYSWHSDLGSSGLMSLRKVSVSLLLNDPDGFVGGDLELRAGGKIIRPKMKQGSAVIFPAWQPHRIVPVSRGHRTSLVLWVGSKRSLR